MNKTALLFPGQGAQVVGMGKDFADSFPAAREVFDRADRILGIPLSEIIFEGLDERLNATDISQPAIFVTSVAIWHALQVTGIIESLSPKAMAGLSLGEYTALHLAGWIDFDEGLRLVAERGRLMQAAAESSIGGMVSVMGLEKEEVLKLCDEAAGSDVLVPANYNCPGQIVISGSVAACDRAVELAEKYQARAVGLKVAGAFHSPLMGPAESGLREALGKVQFKIGEIGVVSNVTADYHGHPEEVRALLCEQVAKPIRWQASIQHLLDAGYDQFVEIGPGRVLTGLMRKINRNVAVKNYSRVCALGIVPA